MSSTAKRDSYQHVDSHIVQSQRERLVWLTIRMSIILIAVVFALFPVVFIISSAFNPSGNLSTQSFIPKGVDSVDELFANFEELMFDKATQEIYPFWYWIGNSLFVATVSTTLILLMTMLSAYSFSRFRFYGRRTLLLGILLIQAFPNLLAIVALFLILLEIGRLADAIPAALPFLDFIDWSWLKLFSFNSLGGLIFVYMGGAMGVNTWLMKGFLDAVPRDIDESATVDGATHWQTFWMLIFPLIRPILAVVGVLAFVGTFNEFILARVLLQDKEQWTLMVGLFNFISADFNRDWGLFAAGALVSGTPIVILYLALQDQIVGGLTAGAVKG